MLIIFTRAIIIYIFLLVVMRLMGKKQLGELQPFEFAISLIVADLACIPMSDVSIPITYGLVPIFTLFVLHLIVTKIVKHSIRLRGAINGNPIIVIGANGIDYMMLKKLDMNINDLMEALRGAGYFSPSEVAYAIVETNGNLTVMPKTSNAPLTASQAQDLPHIVLADASLPISLIVEGKRIDSNIKNAGLSAEDLEKILTYNGTKLRDVLLLTISGSDIYLQPKLKKYVTCKREDIGI